MKKFWYVGLLCVVIVFSVAATSGSERTDDMEKSSAYLSSIRLSQVKRQFAEMPNEQAKVSQVAGGEVQPMTPLSLNFGSACVFSACGGSACGASGCGKSVCGGSACLGSVCVVSACGVSYCGGSACTLSACANQDCLP